MDMAVAAFRSALGRQARNSDFEFIKDREASLSLYPSGCFLPEKGTSEY